MMMWDLCLTQSEGKKNTHPHSGVQNGTIPSRLFLDFLRFGEEITLEIQFEIIRKTRLDQKEFLCCGEAQNHEYTLLPLSPPVGLAVAALAGVEMLGLEVVDVSVGLSLSSVLVHGPLRLLGLDLDLQLLSLVSQTLLLRGLAPASRLGPLHRRALGARPLPASAHAAGSVHRSARVDAHVLQMVLERAQLQLKKKKKKKKR
jgi:hypothetical protein